MRRSAAWLVAIPVMVASTQVGHALAYRLAYPRASVRWQVMISTGHGYLSYWPLVFGVAAGMLVVGFAASAVSSVRRRGPQPIPPWAFATLPLAGFTMQEFIERWLAGSNFPWWTVLQPTFRYGLALQLPFALVAFLLVRALMRTAERVAIVLRGDGEIAQPQGGAPSWSVRTTWPVRSAVLADGHAGRGPPLLVVAPGDAFLLTR